MKGVGWLVNAPGDTFESYPDEPVPAVNATGPAPNNRGPDRGPPRVPSGQVRAPGVRLGQAPGQVGVPPAGVRVHQRA